LRRSADVQAVLSPPLLDAIESSLAVLVVFAATAAVLSFLRPAARQAQ
jgi:hypothetical protein